MPINQTANISNALVEAYGIASEKRNEFITPEHLLAGFLKDSDFWEVLGRCGRAEELEKNLYEYINGLDILGDISGLSGDMVHPNIYGISRMISRFTERIKV